MQDFDHWFSQQGAPDLSERLEAVGFDQLVDGSVLASCCVCGRRIVLTDYLSAEECLEADPRHQYCGSSPQCCP